MSLNQGSAVASWLALLPHSENVQGLNPPSALSGVCMFSPCSSHFPKRSHSNELRVV